MIDENKIKTLTKTEAEKQANAFVDAQLYGLGENVSLAHYGTKENLQFSLKKSFYSVLLSRYVIVPDLENSRRTTGRPSSFRPS